MSNFKPRMLDFSCLDKKVNGFEVRDENRNIICDDCSKHNGLKEGEMASFFSVGLQEATYTIHNKTPITINTTGTPSFEIIKYLHQKKKMSIRDIFILYLRMCEGCVNELDSYITGKSYKRKVNTSCDFCKEIKKERKSENKIKKIIKKIINRKEIDFI